MIAPIIVSVIAALAFYGDVVGQLIACAWLTVGAYFVTQTESRGLYADIVFLFTWPIHVWLEWDE
ncbi:hypothetical protein M9978_16650 [Sphingomonas sp. MG17]|uniref:Uncharacterized protein n=1 Tax=Sphingomonas tagetis TaxID=2949092 RepID=A0A9X2KN09_9SPHN|nr:hypothetical protein [Sphingomonas tagetis]MCP3732056.1 hypothetical protein [Sphingomonas tagetis]